jgi:DNA-binding SARP family transcriptional activator
MTTRLHRSSTGSTAESPRLGLHLFGGPYVTVGGSYRAVPDGSKRLLAFAALQRGRLDRRYVAGTLWPAGRDERAAGNLRSALWRLRGSGIDLLTVDKVTLCLRDGVIVDATEIGDWAMRLIRGTASETDLTIPSASLEALDLLPGWYDDWALAERERLRLRMLHAFEALSRHFTVCARYAEAVEVALLAVNAEPLRESAQRVLIEAHLVEQNVAEACRAFDAYRIRLRDELDAAPSAGLVTLLNASRQRYLHVDLPPRSAPSRYGAAATAPDITRRALSPR